MKLCMLLFGIVAMTLVMSACGGDDDDASSDPSSTPGAIVPTVAAALTQAAGAGNDDNEDGDPCSLLTPAEIEAAVGFPAGEGSLEGSDECLWEVGPPDEFRTVTLAVATADMFDAQRPDVVDIVEGLGDEAYWMSGLSWLWVRQGDDAISVQVATLQQPEAALESAKTLARLALDRR